MRWLIITAVGAMCLSCRGAAPLPPHVPERRIYGFPPPPPDCRNPATCGEGFGCGPCAECPDEEAPTPRRRVGIGVVDLRVVSERDGAPVPRASVSVALEAAADAGLRWALSDFAPTQLLTDEQGRARAVLRMGHWQGTVGRAGGYPETRVSFDVPQCLTAIEVKARPLSREDVPPELLRQGVSCDWRQLTCKQAGLACAPGFTASIPRGCFDRCVPIDACLCTEDAACPTKACEVKTGRCRAR